MRTAVVALVALGLAGAGEAQLFGPCPNGCNGNGLCEMTECKCFSGWYGGDCGKRLCPKGVAWNDEATGADQAHNLAECSNRGRCDRETGQCVCDLMFTGRACEESKCPNNCWGNGRCIDMKYNALFKDPGLGTIYTYESVWDATKMYGCKCDSGFTGYDCSLRECPRGDDPMTEGQLDERQLLHCNAEQGFFTLAFQGHVSEPIPVVTLLSDFEELVEAIPGVGDIEVVFSEVGLPVCIAATADPGDVDKLQVVSITFKENLGDIPALTVASTHGSDCANSGSANLCGGSQVVIAANDGSIESSLTSTTSGLLSSQQGTKENEYCSRRGRCDQTTGVCTCYTNFRTSNGRKAEGIRGDCGFPSANPQACPGLLACSGHGVCSEATEYRCTCSVGWTSGDCSLRTCPVGKAWFDMPIDDDRAHQLAECSNMGICDRTTGECRCHTGFSGAACSKMDCPGSPTECSGHGTCYSMAQLAQNALANGDLAATTYGNVPNDPFRWDYDMVHGCQCDIGWQGHDCSLKSCPTGDDPETGPGLHEVQVLKCTGDGGNLKLYFRREYTDLLDWDLGPDELKAALVSLGSIRDVTVTYSSGSSLCTAGGTNVVSITFTQELGDLPLLYGYIATNGAALTHSTLAPSLEITANGGIIDGVQSVQGTMEDAECSRRGSCNHETGQCSCFSYFASSDGSGGSGLRGDCGWKVPWGTNTES